MKKKLIEFKYEYLLITIFFIMSITACSHVTINYDEYYTMQWCRIDLSDFLYEVLHDTSPFLYYFMVKAYLFVTGGSVFAARIFSLLALIIIFLIGTIFVHKNFGKKAMFFYLCILYLNPFMLQKSTEIRMYLWATAFLLLSALFCYQLLQFPNRRSWIFFTLFSLLAAYTHYYCVISSVFLYLGLLFYYLCTHQKAQQKNWFICCAATCIAYLPFLLIAIAQIKESSGGWITKPSSRLTPIKELFYSEFPGSEYLYLGMMAGFTLYALILFLKKPTAKNWWSVLCCSSFWGISILGILFGELVRPILLSRYLIMSVCLVFLGISPVLKHTSKYLLLILCLLITVISCMRYASSLKVLKQDKTIDTITFAQNNIQEGDQIILISGDDYFYNCAEFYIPQAHLTYVHDFDIANFEKKQVNDKFWFFDKSNDLDADALQMHGLTAQDYGVHQFGYLYFTIYLIQ